jgi:hypothetical protein
MAIATSPATGTANATTIPVSDCSVFIQIWVDTNALQSGSTAGVYLVDNMLNNGSSSEGTPNLSTNVSQNTKICWQVFNINPNSQDNLTIQSIGNASVWGFTGQPEQAPDVAGAWTGQAQNTGSAPYTITFISDGGDTVTVTPQMNVH